jgi:hypothetical protein
MKAAVVNGPSGPEVLRIENRPVPIPRAGEVLIRVKAFGLNRSELFTRQDHSPGVSFPRVLGVEATGLVAEAPRVRARARTDGRDGDGRLGAQVRQRLPFRRVRSISPARDRGGGRSCRAHPLKSARPPSSSASSLDGGRQLTVAREDGVDFYGWHSPLGEKTHETTGETVGSGSGYREAFASRRCAVVTTGFYEWPPVKGNAPTFYHRADDGLVLLGDLSQRPKGGDTHARFTVLTTKPNALVARVHDRMPLILPVRRLDEWLGAEPADAVGLIGPAPEDALVATAVSKHVNSVRNDDPECVLPAERGPELTLQRTASRRSEQGSADLRNGVLGA